MANIFLLSVILAASVATAAGYTGADLPPGPYCGGPRGKCCTSREDGCSHMILDTLCYCDEFCNRTQQLMENNDDCCPDYVPVCLHIEVPQNIVEPTCEHEGQKYYRGKKIMKDCNACTCIKDDINEVYRWECEQDQCIISEDVLRGVRAARDGWAPANYSQFRPRKLKDGLVYLLGTNELSPMTRRMGYISYDKDIEYPRQFDARDKWPQFISPPRDQGWCGADWAVSIATVASDRFAIQSNGAEKVSLSPQMLVSCNERYQRGCDGGNIDVAWNYVSNVGLVDEDCFPYTAKKTQCPYRKDSTLIADGCTPVVKQRVSRYRVGPASRLKKETDIMYDIMESGPVQALMTVYQDFFHYREGIYRHTQYGDQVAKGLHSVRIIGWGEERGQKYWTVVNSWGAGWGEAGHVRVARGADECGLESFVLTVLSDVTEAFQRK